MRILIQRFQINRKPEFLHPITVGKGSRWFATIPEAVKYLHRYGYQDADSDGIKNGAEFHNKKAETFATVEVRE